MTRQELIEQMKREGLRLDMLCTENDIPSECFVIRKIGKAWVTFYAERGIETGRQTFLSEEAACLDLLKEMRRYANAACHTHS